jgi:hypothetical protein
MTPFVGPTPFVRSFSFPDGQHRVKGGCAVVVARDEELVGNQEQAERADPVWDEAQTAAFLAGEPLTLGWVSQSPPRSGSERAYIYCWITIDDD